MGAGRKAGRPREAARKPRGLPRRGTGAVLNRVDLSPRLSFWTAPHPSWKPNPDWPEEVGCVLYATDDCLVLVDPLIRDDLDPDAWDWLDGLVTTSGTPVTVLLTAPWHLRSTPAVVGRYGARVWAAAEGRARAGELPWCDDLTGGIEVFTPGVVDEGQVAFWLPEEHALVAAEFFAGSEGGLRVLASPLEQDLVGFMDSLEPLRELPIEHVLVAHGEPVLGRGADAVAAALDEFRQDNLP